MKKILYIFISLFLVSAIHSCKKIGDDDGNLLNDMGLNNGLLGENRFLYQEVTSADTIAEYHYTGRKLTKVLGDSTLTNIIYSGDLINSIDFNGIVEGDSIVYTQLFNYNPNNNNILSNITETKSIYKKIKAQHLLPPPLVATKTKSKYDITFNTAGKLDNVIKKTGNDLPLTTFNFTSYQKTTYTYDALQNVTKAAVAYGGVAAGVLQAPSNNVAYDFGNYDDKKSPYRLIPFGYLLHKSFENSFNNYRFSPNNPKRVMLSGDLIPVPIPYNTLYTYDHLGYALTGWGVNYEYRPF